MRVAFLLQPAAADDPRPLVSPVTTGIIAGLLASGSDVDLIVPEAELLDLANLEPRADLYVLKSQTALALSWAGALTVAGADVVNTHEASVLVRDKITSTAILAATGVPVPPSWATGHSVALHPLLQDGPCWLKPAGGRHGLGVRRLGSAADLNGSEDDTDACGVPRPLLAQREAPSAGFDLKVYVVGARVWGVARRFPARTIAEKLGSPVTPTPAIRAAAVACGRALGLELYGVDVLTSDDRFVVIDVNAFPGYKGAWSAPGYLAAYIYDRAAGHRAPGRRFPEERRA